MCTYNALVDAVLGVIHQKERQHVPQQRLQARQGKSWGAVSVLVSLGGDGVERTKQRESDERRRKQLMLNRSKRRRAFKNGISCVAKR